FHEESHHALGTDNKPAIHDIHLIPTRLVPRRSNSPDSSSSLTSDVSIRQHALNPLQECSLFLPPAATVDRHPPTSLSKSTAAKVHISLNTHKGGPDVDSQLRCLAARTINNGSPDPSLYVPLRMPSPHAST